MKQMMKRMTVVLACSLCLTAVCGCGGTAEETDTLASESVSETVEERYRTGSDQTIHTITPADAFDGGSGTEDDPYQIATAEQLAYLGVVSEWNYDDWLDYCDAYYVLTDDIYLNDTADWENWGESAPEYAWIPIQDFQSCFDGQGHTVYGMYINDMSAVMNYDDFEADLSQTIVMAGLFSDVDEGLIQNVNIAESYLDVSFCSEVGALVGSASCDVSGCTSGAILHTEGLGDIGGIVGSEWGDGTISDCMFSGQMIAGDEASDLKMGGIVGTTGGSVIDCVNEGIILDGSGVFGYVGGIVGFASSGSNSQIRGCVNKSDLNEVSSKTGGIIGALIMGYASELVNGEWNYTNGSLTVDNCRNEGSVTFNGEDDDVAIGGIIGDVYDSDDRVDALSITNCENIGIINGVTYVGGIIGSLQNGYAEFHLENCTNSGAVSGDLYVGGIVGYAVRPCAEATLRNCVNMADVTAESASVGGIVGVYTSITLLGEHEGTFLIESCTNNGNVSSNSSISGTGGILGGTLGTTSDGSNTLILTDCLNSGEIYSEQSGHVGGIIGSTSVLTSGIEIRLTACGNTGAIGIGDMTASYSELGISEEHTTDERLILFLGGSCIGGIAGEAENISIEDCVNTGSILLDSAMMANEIYVGSIVGQYRYLESTEYMESSGIQNCFYTTPETPYQGEDGSAFIDGLFSNLQRISAEEAEELIEDIKN